jgi:hypothetical protein
MSEENPRCGNCDEDGKKYYLLAGFFHEQHGYIYIKCLGDNIIIPAIESEGFIRNYELSRNAFKEKN